ncbi:CbtA family protein [Nocardioides sp. InS609-2]|uniref:CbtA family protein n=1 Tax=Nocardioides sp. InS609-2 TaxID=2760705 RepID=UPI0020BD75E0|nr:CbtA family protein [Nocardioides sp. InS609-2]
MSARNFLVRGLLAGLIAGLAAFGVAYFVGEPQVQAAIELEEAGSAPAPTATAEETGSHDGEEAGHSHDEEGTVVARHNQRTWGLLTGTLGIGVALGGIVALVSAAVVGRLGRLAPGQSTALVALMGFVSVALIPFLKYPASPPAVGNAETIGSRTGLYFIYLVISVAVAVASVVLADRLWRDHGSYVAVVASGSLFLVVTVVSGQLLPTVNELGDFPADTLWYFRRAAILTQATMWGVLGVALVGLTRPLFRRDLADAERRELAASL